MAQWYDIGLQAGKLVAEAVDKVIAELHTEESNFDPKKRTVLSNGSVTYYWYAKWDPGYFKSEERLMEVLNTFNNEKCDEAVIYGSEQAIDLGWKLVAVGDEGGQDEAGNEIGFEKFDGLYRSNTIVFPKDTPAVTIVPKVALVMNCSWDSNGVYLFDTQEEAIAALKYCYDSELAEQEARREDVTYTYSHTIAEDGTYARFVYVYNDGETEIMDWTVVEPQDGKLIIPQKEER